MSMFIDIPTPRVALDFWDRYQLATPDEPHVRTHAPGCADGLVGFEDVLEGAALGSGRIYNHSGTVLQLITAVGILAKSATTDILNETEQGTIRDTVALMRERQILHGRKVIDLGCGIPNFALAIQSLGAEAYTTDMKDIASKYKASLSGHTVVDLSQADADKILLDATGGNADLVTSNMVVFETSDIFRERDAQERAVSRIALSQLRDGGFLAREFVGINLQQKQ